MSCQFGCIMSINYFAFVVQRLLLLKQYTVGLHWIRSLKKVLMIYLQTKLKIQAENEYIAHILKREIHALFKIQTTKVPDYFSICLF